MLFLKMGGRLTDEEKTELLGLIGKKVKNIAIGEDGMDVIFDDGTVLELYFIKNEGWGGCISSEEEVKKEEND